MNFIDYKISERLRQLRTSSGLTQQQLAEKMGLRSNSIARFETGTGKPSLDTLVNLALIFDVSLDYLIGRTDNPNIITDADIPKNIKSNNKTEEIIDKIEEIDQLLIDLKNKFKN